MLNGRGMEEDRKYREVWHVGLKEKKPKSEWENANTVDVEKLKKG